MNEQDELKIVLLVDMGFPADVCRRAIIATRGQPIESALNWMFHNSASQCQPVARVNPRNPPPRKQVQVVVDSAPQPSAPQPPKPYQAVNRSQRNNHNNPPPQVHSKSVDARSLLNKTARGRIKNIKATQGYGFITIDNTDTDLFFHFSNIEGPRSHDLHPAPGMEVEFLVTSNPRKQNGLRALNVRFVHALEKKLSASAPRKKRGIVEFCTNDGGLIIEEPSKDCVFFIPKDICDGKPLQHGDKVAYWVEKRGEEIIGKEVQLLTVYPISTLDSKSHYMWRGESIKADDGDRDRDEDRHNEFKSLARSGSPHSSMIFMAEKYLNGFLNTNGGTIYFGVEDDGIVSALTLDRSQRDYIRVHVDTMFRRHKPPVLSSAYTITFHPVVERFLDTVVKLRNYYVVSIKVAKGTHDLYETSEGKSFYRRDGSTLVMTPMYIQEQLQRKHAEQQQQDNEAMKNMIVSVLRGLQPGNVVGNGGNGGNGGDNAGNGGDNAGGNYNSGDNCGNGGANGGGNGGGVNSIADASVLQAQPGPQAKNRGQAQHNIGHNHFENVEQNVLSQNSGNPYRVDKNDHHAKQAEQRKQEEELPRTPSKPSGKQEGEQGDRKGKQVNFDLGLIDKFVDAYGFKRSTVLDCMYQLRQGPHADGLDEGAYHNRLLNMLITIRASPKRSKQAQKPGASQIDQKIDQKAAHVDQKAANMEQMAANVDQKAKHVSLVDVLDSEPKPEPPIDISAVQPSPRPPGASEKAPAAQPADDFYHPLYRSS